MKVKLGQLNPNPWRNQEEATFDPVRLELLKVSIEKTGFWDILLARPDEDGGCQIAFGHHRLKVALELFGEDHEVDIPVKDLSDEQMLTIMAQENETHFAHDVCVLKQTIQAAQKFFKTKNGKRKYAEIKKKMQGASTSQTKREIDINLERKIYAVFLGFAENRVRIGRGLVDADNPRLDAALAKANKGGVTHASGIIENLSEDKKSAADLAELAVDQGFNTKATRAVAQVLKHADKKDRPKILKKVEKRPKSTTPEDAAHDAAIQIATTSKGRDVSGVPQTSSSLDGEKTLINYTARLHEIVIGLPDLLQVFSEFKPHNQNAFKQATTELFRILNTKFKIVKEKREA